MNALVASFNGRLQDDCLNELFFPTFFGAYHWIAAWRQDHIHRRPPLESRRPHLSGASPTVKSGPKPEQSQPTKAEAA
ncbi:hypothetical protein [Tateyamaria sp. SN3-11]|uniref:hypothetical protein n=1 Tax=Tateyamaria sp. SN3-11 TaxID=3092147 RepID=UPI0039EA2582